MNYQQLIQPDLSIVGVDGECLVYVREVFGAVAKYPTASVAWQNAIQHTGTPPANNAVPIWFSWQTDGHVAVWDNGTIYSTTAQGDKTFDSIPDLIAFIQEGIEYLGWSEDINSKRVVQPQEVNVNNTPNLNGGDVSNIWPVFEGHPSSQADVDNWVTANQGNWKTLVYDLLMPLMAQAQEQIKTLESQTTSPTVLAPGTYEVQ